MSVIIPVPEPLPAYAASSALAATHSLMQTVAYLLSDLETRDGQIQRQGDRIIELEANDYSSSFELNTILRRLDEAKEEIASLKVANTDASKTIATLQNTIKDREQLIDYWQQWWRQEEKLRKGSDQVVSTIEQLPEDATPRDIYAALNASFMKEEPSHEVAWSPDEKDAKDPYAESVSAIAAKPDTSGDQNYRYSVRSQKTGRFTK